MQPMLAYQKLPDLGKLRYPLFASPKLDGVRALVKGSQLISRKLLPIPNKFVAARFSSFRYEGLDGELILGDPTSPTVFRDTSAALRREEGEPDVKLHVFDYWSRTNETYEEAVDRLGELWKEDHIVVVDVLACDDDKAVLRVEKKYLDLGYEGLILRDPGSAYKFGRSNMTDQGMVKLKRFVDAEATIVGFEEEMHNANVAKKDRLGRTKRSSHQENMVGKGTLGAFICRDEVNFPGQEFEVGVGLTDDFAAWAWAHRKELLGKALKYKHFPKGGKDKPRHAVFLGLRDKWDM